MLSIKKSNCPDEGHRFYKSESVDWADEKIAKYRCEKCGVYDDNPLDEYADEKDRIVEGGQ